VYEKKLERVFIHLLRIIGLWEMFADRCSKTHCYLFAEESFRSTTVIIINDLWKSLLHVMLL